MIRGDAGPGDELGCAKSCSAGFTSVIPSGRRKRIRVREFVMPYTVDFNTVSPVGLESSPVAAALAGLRANEARFVKNRWDHVFTVEPASDAKSTIDWVHGILKGSRGIGE
jgi:hypothetical protein